MIDYQRGPVSFRVNCALVGERPPTLSEVNAMIAREYLKAFNFNQTRTAEALGITRTTLRSLCAKHNINMRN